MTTCDHPMAAGASPSTSLKGWAPTNLTRSTTIGNDKHAWQVGDELRVLLRNSL